MKDLLNQTVVVDVIAPYVYVGTLAGINETSIRLTNVDVHDLRDSNSTRERYVLHTRRDGVRVNRDEAWVRLDQIVSVSRLEDIVL